MTKLACGIFVGIFAGALAMEVLKRANPIAAGALQAGCARLVGGVWSVLAPGEPGKTPEKGATDGAEAVAVS
ncbi:MAG: hypothetical protein AB1634_09730 [Thermodesulfobacteriota bacterium]